MSATINIIETTTELGLEVVEVVVASASTPGPAGPGVPIGGTDGQVLTKTSATDYATAWEDPTGGVGGGAPTTVDYLVGTASGDLSAEIVVGTSPGGELGGTWAAPTVDATHSGSSHAGVQAAAEATASSALTAHEVDTTAVHGIANTANLYSVGGTDVAIADGGTGASTAAGARANLDLEAGVDFPSLTTFNDHLADAIDAHDASAISVLDTGTFFTATDVEGVLAEIAPQLGGGSGESFQRDISQATHGLAVGNVVRHNGTNYVKAQANSAANAEAAGIVVAVADVNNFTLHYGGRITGLSGLTAGTVYFLSAATAGLLTATEPNVVGEVSKPLLVSDSTTSGYFFNFRGVVISEINAPLGWTTVTKAVDESVSSSVTYQADNELFFATVAGAIYEVELTMVFASPAGAGTPDIRFGFGEDTTIRGAWNGEGLNATEGLTLFQQGLQRTSGGQIAGTAASNRALRLIGTYWGNGGTAELVWAQGTSDINATIMRAGSVLRYRRVI